MQIPTKYQAIAALALVAVIALYATTPSLEEKNKAKKLQIIQQAQADLDMKHQSLKSLEQMVEDTKIDINTLKTCIDKNDPNKTDYIARDCKSIDVNTGNTIQAPVSVEKPRKVDWYITPDGVQHDYNAEQIRLKWWKWPDNKSQEFVGLSSKWIDSRTQEMLEKFGAGKYNETFKKWGSIYNIKPEVGVCIAKSETSLGNDMTTNGNWGNVGNTNSCPTCQKFDSHDEGIRRIFQTLRNSYLGKYTMIGEFYYETSKQTPFYANGMHAPYNVMNCLSEIYDEHIDTNFQVHKLYKDRIILHNTGAPIDSEWSKFANIAQYHHDKFGTPEWSCAYNVFVGSDGTIKECTPIDAIKLPSADPTDYNNYRGIHIAFAGNAELTYKQKKVWLELINKYLKQYNISKKEVYAHYDFNQKTKEPNESIQTMFWVKNRIDIF